MSFSQLTVKEDLKDIFSYGSYFKMSKEGQKSLHFKTAGTAVKVVGASILFFSAVTLVHTAANLPRTSLFYGTVKSIILGIVGHDVLRIGQNMREATQPVEKYVARPLQKATTFIKNGVIGTKNPLQGRAYTLSTYCSQTLLAKKIVALFTR